MIHTTQTMERSISLEEYEERGFAIVRGLFDQLEMFLVAAECESLLRRRELIASPNLRCRWQPHVETDECLFETFDPVIDIAPVCARLARDQRILQILSQIYGEEAFLFKDKLIFKPPGARGHNLHQDYIAWPRFPRTFVTVAVAIDPANAGNGATEFFPGYHRQGYLSPADGDYHSLPGDAVDSANGVIPELGPGDAAFFGCFTPHRSGPNRSRSWRRLLYLSYNAASDGGDQRDAHYQEFRVWLTKKYAEYGKTDVYFR